MGEEEDELQGAVTSCLASLLLGIETRLEGALAAMARLNWPGKRLVFAFVTTWIAVFQGYDCEPTSEGISRATTKTVVYASLAVLGLDFILTALMFGDF